MISDLPICFFNNQYKNGAKASTTPTTFGEYIKLIKDPDKDYIKKILLIRKARNDKHFYSTLKRKHAVHYYPSCTFDKKGCKLENVKALSGIMVFDLQHISDESVEKLKKWKHTVALHESVGGGKGDYAYYVYDKDLTLANYRQHWEQCNQLLQQMFSIAPDSSDATKDVTRIRYLSYDPKVYFNKKAAPINLKGTFDPTQKVAIDKLLNDEPNWHKFGVALAVSKGEDGRAIYHEFSSQNISKYDKADTDRKYDRLLKESKVNKKGGITEATLMYMMQQMRLPLKTAKQVAQLDDDKITIETIVAYLNSRWVRNEINDRVLDFTTGKETSIEAVWTHFQHQYHKPSISPSIIHTVARSEHMNTFNPLHNFFSDAEQMYDGKDYLGQYVDCLPAVDKQAALLFISYWCIEAYKQAKFYTTNRSFLIFKGITENIGKSMALGWLSPVEGYLKTGPIVTDLKDTRIALAHNFLWNDDELKIFKSSDINKIKALISTDVINERLPYGRSDETLKRICSFCGSTNADELLPATEGNTRFLVVELEPGRAIKWANYNKIDKKQFWGQIIAMHKADWIKKNSSQLSETRSMVNKGQVINSRTREIVLEKLRGTMHDKKRVVMRLTDIIAELDPMNEQKLSEWHVKDLIVKEFGSGRTNGYLFNSDQRGVGYPCTIKK